VVAKVKAATEVEFHSGARGNLLEGAIIGMRNLEKPHWATSRILARTMVSEWPPEWVITPHELPLLNRVQFSQSITVYDLKNVNVSLVHISTESAPCFGFFCIFDAHGWRVEVQWQYTGSIFVRDLKPLLAQFRIFPAAAWRGSRSPAAGAFRNSENFYGSGMHTISPWRWNWRKDSKALHVESN